MAITKVTRNLLTTGIVDNSNATAITIDSSENVGIGTTSPDNTLHVYKGASGHAWSFDGGDGFILENSDSVSLNIATPNSNNGNILFSDAAARGQGRIVYDHNGDYMALSTNGVSNERLRINSSGAVLVGTTSSTDGLSNTPTKMLVSASDASSGVATPLASFEDMDTSVESGSTILAIGFNADTSFSASNYIRFTDSGGENGSISGTGDGTIDFNTSSDKRRKENIEDAPNTLETLNQVEVKKYNFIGSEKKQIGMLAQDLYEIIPDVVKVGGEDENENPWSINYGRLTPFLIKAIQEQQEQIEQLKTEIQTLKGE